MKKSFMLSSLYVSAPLSILWVAELFLFPTLVPALLQPAEPIGPPSVAMKRMLSMRISHRHRISQLSALAAAATTTSTTTDICHNMQGNESPMVYNRRQIMSQITMFGMWGAAAVARPEMAAAASGKVSTPGPTAEELDRIKAGYQQIDYLLQNWDAATTVCRENGGECKRDADAVRRALGLRSTTDPLFQIEKVFAKVKELDLDPDKLELFFDAAEEWNSALNMSNSMAFISQFGEYNPGGGQDQVLKFLNESRKQVVLAEKSLKTIMDCLEIK